MLRILFSIPCLPLGGNGVEQSWPEEQSRAEQRRTDKSRGGRGAAKKQLARGHGYHYLGLSSLAPLLFSSYSFPLTPCSTSTTTTYTSSQWLKMFVLPFHHFMLPPPAPSRLTFCISPYYRSPPYIPCPYPPFLLISPLQSCLSSR